MENIYLKETVESGKKVLWLNFKCENGSGAMINLNNIANEESSITKKAMLTAINEHFKD